MIEESLDSWVSAYKRASTAVILGLLSNVHCSCEPKGSIQKHLIYAHSNFEKLVFKFVYFETHNVVLTQRVSAGC